MKSIQENKFLFSIALLTCVGFLWGACNHGSNFKKTLEQVADTNSETKVEKLDSFTIEQLAEMTPEEVSQLDESQYDYYDLNWITLMLVRFLFLQSISRHSRLLMR